MNLTDIRYRKEGGVAIATLNRPEVLNAFRDTTYDDFDSILEDVTLDDKISVLILTGEEWAFSAGEDLNELGNRLDETDVDAYPRARIERIQDFTRKMVAMPKIIIAVLNGPAVGIGAELAVAADIRIACDACYFYFPEVKLGLFETNGVTYFLPRLIGAGRAMELFLTGKRLPAARALEWGLVTRVAPQEALMEEAMATAETILSHSSTSVRLLKQAVHQSLGAKLENMLSFETDALLECIRAGETGDNVKVFFEKRPKGKSE